MTLSEAAERLGVSRYRVHRLVRDGRLEAEDREAAFGTKYKTVKRTDVEKLAEERAKEAAGERPAGKRGPKPNPPKDP